MLDAREAWQKSMAIEKRQQDGRRLRFELAIENVSLWTQRKTDRQARIASQCDHQIAARTESNRR